MIPRMPDFNYTANNPTCYYQIIGVKHNYKTNPVAFSTKMYINLNNISILIKGTCIADFPETFILPILNLLLSFCLISLGNYDYMLQYFVS